jgi:hypothetical protein
VKGKGDAEHCRFAACLDGHDESDTAHSAADRGKCGRPCLLRAGVLRGWGAEGMCGYVSDMYVGVRLR